MPAKGSTELADVTVKKLILVTIQRLKGLKRLRRLRFLEVCTNNS